MMHKKNADFLLIKRWWDTIDRSIFLATLLLVSVGTMLIVSISPSIAAQHKWTDFILAKKHIIILCPSLVCLFWASVLGKKKIVTYSIILALCAWMATISTLFVGQSIKGARRWIALGSFALQPSELLKPALTVVTAHLLSQRRAFMATGIILGVALVPLLVQPDLGMSVLLSATWFVQCFLAGLPWLWVGGMAALALAGLGGAYLFLPHVAQRVNIFFSPKTIDAFGSHYQINQAIKSFRSGGLWGQGLGSGTASAHLPDAHADFILAVAGEELGLLFCLMILSVYFIIFVRGIQHALHEMDPFYSLAVAGLVVQVMNQIVLNIASVLNIIPTKGTTLPLLSYGGSSFLATCWTMGLILSLTRRFRPLVDQ